MLTKFLQMAARPKITLYVDTVSPFAYAAYHILRNDPLFRNVEVEYIPIFLGGLMHKCGNTAPIKIKNKDKWINLERLRWAQHFSIPMISPGLPPDFPAPSLPIMRCLASLSSTAQLTSALDLLFKKHWADGVATHKPEILQQTLVELFGEEEAGKILERSKAEGKEALIKNTDRAFDEGAFGLPWFSATNARGEREGFWGVDHMGQLLRFLGLEGELQTARGKGNGNQGWRAVL
ncbi:thioredoxin-like protein [Triangularia verruculosa]|uniref:Glutathione S-transferase kappa n=1 Tax=Triangularia verruculosa TaxID=2587418 RepID=A0AAN6XUB0_9PEZI|nr:thioredoxin-like protein [Triangularia verruculosa]